MFSKPILVTWLLLLFCSCKNSKPIIEDDRFHIRVVDLDQEHLEMYWKDSRGEPIRTFQSLEKHVSDQNQQLLYAMNGGMFLKDNSPQGLFINNGVLLKNADTIQNAYGNFYLQPNGVFGITTHGSAVIQKTSEIQASQMSYATQSGPMLVINGALHPAFHKDSENLHVRNAVGILPDGQLLFVLSKKKINFYDLASFFKNQGCANALYLDGFVSRIYDPENGVEQMDGAFGVIIGLTEPI